MSFTKEKRDNIQRYLMEKIEKGDADFVMKTCASFEVTNKTVYRYLKELTEVGVLTKHGRNYEFVHHEAQFELKRAELSYADEDLFYREHICFSYIHDL